MRELFLERNLVANLILEIIFCWRETLKLLGVNVLAKIYLYVLGVYGSLITIVLNDI